MIAKNMIVKLCFAIFIQLMCSGLLPECFSTARAYVIEGVDRDKLVEYIQNNDSGAFNSEEKAKKIVNAILDRDHWCDVVTSLRETGFNDKQLVGLMTSICECLDAKRRQGVGAGDSGQCAFVEESKVTVVKEQFTRCKYILEHLFALKEELSKETWDVGVIVKQITDVRWPSYENNRMATFELMVEDLSTRLITLKLMVEDIVTKFNLQDYELSTTAKQNFFKALIYAQQGYAPRALQSGTPAKDSLESILWQLFIRYKLCKNNPEAFVKAMLLIDDELANKLPKDVTNKLRNVRNSFFRHISKHWVWSCKSGNSGQNNMFYTFGHSFDSLLSFKDNYEHEETSSIVCFDRSSYGSFGNETNVFKKLITNYLDLCTLKFCECGDGSFYVENYENDVCALQKLGGGKKSISKCYNGIWSFNVMHNSSEQYNFFFKLKIFNITGKDPHPENSSFYLKV